ncbi:putative phosphatase regulatory subunit-domain-containing protein [Lentinula aciculospora]|uniref:Phosphatase regulatory subunit-domain-containing protein n=1 Tax=Lentinula aciculospora TaxID=153920 RepID=A0A9W9DL59_9AGAR|nr:putative phosphatase regulatory subunit-domain-containing protein [Lentinula aciculospora]
MTLSASLSSNTAGSPLPLLPRRSSTSRSYASPNVSGIISPPRVTPSPVKITVQQATPPEDDKAVAFTSGTTDDSTSSSSSSSSSGGRLSPVQARGRRNSRKVVQTDPASPTLAFPRTKKERPSVQTEKRSRAAGSESTFGNGATSPILSLEGLPKTLIKFPSVEQSTHKSAPVPPVIVVRKKSGQLVKPSLKSKSAFKGSLNVTPGGFTKSEPATPTVPKAVKFDSRLEHVKLFLAEQRPLAVSRDGSPTDDTSGTESDFPSFIFGDQRHKVLKMRVTNMPPSLNLLADIVLEEMKLGLDESSIVGRVRVRNLSFQKWVAVRFTFDDWQTTSEVTAKYTGSYSSEFDFFEFSIRLSDLVARIEEKTLVVALRYNVNGKEIWDNNFGRNYVVKFSKEMPTVEPPKGSKPGSDQDVISSGSDISDLHTRLEKVVKRRDDDVAASTPPYSQLPLISPDVSLDLKTDISLGSRYDFGASLKNSLKRIPIVSPREHTRMHSYPIVAGNSANAAPWPEMSRKRRSLPKEHPTLGSPRDLGDTFRPAPFIPSDSEDGLEVAGEHIGRHHQRGYFDLSPLGSSSSVKMTPPGTPRSRSLDDTTPVASPRLNSLPSMRPGSPFHPPGLGFAISPKDAAFAEASDGASSLISPPVSNATTPTDSPDFATSPLVSPPGTNYSQFLNRFCFFTGSQSGGNSSDESAPETLSRSSSTSSLDDFLSSSSSSPRLFDPAFRIFTPQPVTQTRDDISLRIGLSIQEPYIESESRSVTPVAR